MNFVQEQLNIEEYSDNQKKKQENLEKKIFKNRKIKLKIL